MMDCIRRAWWGGLVLALAVPAWGVKTATWTQQNPKDFSEGTFEQTVVSSHGELMLGRAVTVLHKTKEQAEVVNALARGPDGAVYAATGGTGHIYRVAGDEVTTFAKLPDKNVFSLLFAKDGTLLAGTGGERGRIFRISADGTFAPFFEPAETAYVWAMVRGSQGEIYAATGTEGKLFRIDPTGKESDVLYDAKQKSLLCLAADRQGLLYAGTDTDGLVLRIDPASGAAYVLYDAKEAEISALAIDTNTNVYAATASAAAAKPGRTLGEKPGGKPESAPAVEDRPSPTAMTLPAALAEAMKQKAAGSTPAAAGPAEGNAIYRVDRDGFVTEVFREPVMILALHEEAGTLYAATGNEGRIYEIVPADEVTMNVAKLESSQAVSLIRLDDGSFIIGAANEGAIARMAPGFADKGTFVCKPLDAGQIVRFGRVRWRADIPGGTKLSLATRSGNVEDPDDATWASWSDEVDATNSAQIASASARFLQYRLTFETTNPKRSAVLSQLDVARLEDNRPPVIAGLRVGSAKELASQPAMAALKAKLGPMLSKPDGQQNLYAIAWQAQDPNGDELIYDIFYRETGFRRWIRLEEDFKETVTLWDTQTVPDGEYRVRIVAKDAPSNPVSTALSYARVSEPVIVDNTPPVIRIERFQVDGKTLRIRATVKDALLPLASARYTVNSHDEWKVIAPADDIFDSPEETLEFVIENLEVGEHVVAIAVADKNDNTTLITRAVTVEP